MESSNPSRSELPQLVTHHLFRESEGEEGSAVVDLNLEAHQLGKNHRPTGPESDFLEEATFLGVLFSDDLLPSTEESRFQERALPDRAGHEGRGVEGNLGRKAKASSTGGGGGGLTLGGSAPGSDRGSSPGGLSLSSPVGVVNGVHGHPSDPRSTTQPPSAAGLPQVLGFEPLVGQDSQRGPTSQRKERLQAGRKTDPGIISTLVEKKGRGPRTPHQLTPSPRLNLQVVKGDPQREVPKRKTVPWTKGSPWSRGDLIPRSQTLWS